MVGLLHRHLNYDGCQKPLYQTFSKCSLSIKRLVIALKRQVSNSRCGATKKHLREA